ncbi:MAG TPA: hypothetical protein VH117_08190 [Edaphobacter sp.]|nr:hypothetical protein [Edaphobacter sp.]
MSRQNELNSYIAGLQRRLRLGAWLRGAAIFIGTALVVTVALVLLLNHYAFPTHGVAGARMALLVALAAVAGFGIALPLARLTRARAVRAAEAAHPGLEQRLTTFHEREREGGDPFLELLAADTLSRTQDAAPSSLVPDNRLFALGGAGLGCLGVLVWMIAAGPGYLGYGASLLWTGPKKNVAPLYAITVAPGDVAVRRNSDQLITAQVTGMRPEKVQIFAHYQSAGAWEPVTMQAQPDLGGAATYQFVFAGLPENVEYYVAAGPLVSPHYKVRVVDLPSVKGIRVTYQYPKWTGMKPVTEEHSGDLRAIEGTDAAISIEMDRPLKDGHLALDGGKTIQLASSQGNRYQGTIHMEKDGAYHVSATDEGQPVRLSEDYFIATDKAMPPEVAISRPGGDYRASPIEEVTVAVKAADQFGLNDVYLHYSVNGGPDRDVSMLKAPGAKEADGSYTLRLEDFKLVPGDLVSVYATAKDGHSEARTEISFIQADPFEREFSQSQQRGGGGGGGGGQNNQTEISKREKELIAATWKQQNDKAATPKDASVAGQFLSDAQQKLRDQVMALSARIQSRDLSQANEEFTGFEKDMQTAAEAMAPSADKLKGMQWKDAIPLEQKALQALLRAEATFRQIQVAFGQQGGGGGGGGGNAGRDLANLFDLELDTEKNQYETAQTASPAEQHEKNVEDALAKLDALAKRQEELANQQHNPHQSFQERWQQEMLRREAEQLQRQMEQLAQNGQGQQGGQQQNGQQQNGQQQNGQQSSGGQSASQSSQSGSQQQRGSSQGGSQASRQQAGSKSSGQSQDQRIEQALSRLRQAGDAMKRSAGPQQSADAARQAADRLREATGLLGGTQQQLASGKIDSLSHEADRITQEERAQADRIQKLGSQQSDSGEMDRDSMMARLQERNRLAGERQQLSNDLSKLQKGVRDAARDMAPNQPGVAQKLRDALTEMDQSDLDNHVQRTADWLRGGVNPNSNGTENQIAQGLQKLSQQLRQAQQGIGEGKPGQRGTAQGDETAALNQVERLRSQLEAMASSRRGDSRQPGQNGQNGQQGRNGQGAQNNQPGQNGNQQAQANGNGEQRGQQARGGQQSDQNARGGQQQAGGGFGQPTGDRTGERGGQSGDVRYGGGGGADGTVWGNINTGNNRYSQAGQRPAPPDASGNPADTERTYQQGVRELSQLRQMIQGDPQAAKEVQELTRQMQRLDPSRFPGNPAMVEQMHREMLSSIDRIELQLQHNGASTEARTGKPYAVPAGYQDSVAEYYRRLSKNQ